jgi:hypothetical protein
MKRFTYDTMQVDASGKNTATNAKYTDLSAAGRDGWDVFAVTPFDGAFVAWMKRESTF